MKTLLRSYTLMDAADYYTRYVDLAEERGGNLISTEYVNCRTKLRWKCGLGHVFDALPGNIMHGSWCPKCGKKESGRKRSRMAGQIY